MTRGGVVRIAVCVYAVLVLLAGCMALPRPDSAIFQDPHLASRGTLPLSAAMMTLTDARPPGERQQFPEFGDIPERATLQLLMDWSEARLFTNLYHVKEPKGADIVIRGELRSLRWEAHHRVAPYVPGLAFLAALGVPVADSKGEVEIALEIFDPRKVGTIAAYTKAARRARTYWVYRFQDARAGDQLDGNSAFQQVSEGLQIAILEDRDRIVAAAKPGS